MTGAVTFLGTLLCPSDTGETLQLVSNGYYATHNYSMNTGSGFAVTQQPTAPMLPPNGVFYENSRTSPAEILDGLSSTIVISES